MKRILLIAFIGFCFSLIGCTKKSNNCNCPGNNNWSQPTDSLLHVTGTVNATTMVESSTYKVGSTTKVTLGWPTLKSGCQDVQISFYLYDGANNATPLWQDSKVINGNGYQITMPTHYSCITDINKALLQIVIVPLACSGKKSAQYNLYLAR